MTTAKFTSACAALLIACASISACSSGSDVQSSAQSSPQSAQQQMSGGYVVNKDGTLAKPQSDIKVPVLDKAALQFNETGAQLAAKHFLALTEYAWETGNTKPMRAFSSKECKFCTSVANSIDKLYKSGGWRHGLKYSIKSSQIEKLKDSESPNTYGALMEISSSKNVKYSGASPENIPSNSTNLAIWIQWNGKAWNTIGGATIEADS